MITFLLFQNNFIHIFFIRRGYFKFVCFFWDRYIVYNC